MKSSVNYYHPESQSNPLHKLAGRIFPFFIFEVHRRNKNIFTEKQHEFLCLNFIEMILEETKGSQSVRSYNFSSIKVRLSLHPLSKPFPKASHFRF